MTNSYKHVPFTVGSTVEELLSHDEMRYLGNLWMDTRRFSRVGIVVQPSTRPIPRLLVYNHEQSKAPPELAIVSYMQQHMIRTIRSNGVAKIIFSGQFIDGSFQLVVSLSRFEHYRPCLVNEFRMVFDIKNISNFGNWRTNRKLKVSDDFTEQRIAIKNTPVYGLDALIEGLVEV